MTDRNEYVFDESGGRGTLASSFFKRMSSSKESSVNDSDQRVVGAQYSPADALRLLNLDSAPPASTSLEKLCCHSYADSDDDWDADVDVVSSNRKPSKSIYTNDKRRSFSSQTTLSSKSNSNRQSQKSISLSQSPEPQNQYRSSRVQKFQNVLNQPNINIDALKKLAWSGVPAELRAIVWKLLLGYLPASSPFRLLKRKRQEYLDGVHEVFNNQPRDAIMWHQIEIDVPRTNPHMKLYSFPATQSALERILYLWAKRHPASGYVQGINDLVTPFFQTFLAAAAATTNIASTSTPNLTTSPINTINSSSTSKSKPATSNLKSDHACGSVDIENYDPAQLSSEVLNAIEADTYWCLCQLLDGIQDNYVHAQPGIIRQVRALRELTMRIDPTLVDHFDHEQVQFIQFAFRWMNCLLMREVSVGNTIRMWDTYLSEGVEKRKDELEGDKTSDVWHPPAAGTNGFRDFHVYVCAALVVKWSAKLKEMDFQDIMIFLQALPTKHWTETDIELLLSQAFMYQSLYKNAAGIAGR
ncbi:RabGAP/TBC [Nadsonia fulvescens var. elongata DSM 6958]|uniref:RabGAP/TBC n=1 Tax=Nadsonia fulvescens var. elongata DSM 6958 TaxID=857566 RepID=A0A1E3PPR5_9ASCO|nr:RabGAP/TBC [Nadsonia fulvescens var. elongata DSM 6958]